MATAVIERGGVGAPRPGQWRRRYPPLVALAIAVAIALFVLPSALNLPQANPSTTVELAPVPPNDQNTPPIPSNISTLSFGQTPTQTGTGAQGGAGGGEGSGLLPPQVPEPIRSKTPSTKNCVGTPPRQTEDPLSPPCVADFVGNNGGATYQGVTGQEVRIVIYTDGGISSTPTPRGTDTTPTNEIVDVDAPPKPNEDPWIWINRAWAAYFNNRFQLYGRRAHFYLQFSSTDPNAPNAGAPFTPTSRQADAAQIYAAVRPFAVISYASFAGAADFYLKYLAQRGVLNFGSVVGRSETFFQQYPKLIWGYPPPIEQQAAEFSSLVCTKLAPYPTSFSGTSVAHGQKRKFGLVETTDPGFANFRIEAELVRSEVKSQCGVDIPNADVVTYPTNGFTVDTSTLPQYAINNMLKLSQDHVTTILWPIGLEIKQGSAASQLGYQPEWVLGDDNFQAATTVAQQQDQTQWAHAWITASVTKVGTLQQDLCYQAYREADPSAADSDVQNYACPEYNDLRQLFTGIQVAGPKLGPFSVDKGFHAIPSVASTDPRIPACFYNAADYTCVKDAVIEYWDPNAPGFGTTSKGCWKMIEAGKRYLIGQFPGGDVTTQRQPADQCNNYDANYQINVQPPS
jgi:hypothetical protein